MSKDGNQLKSVRWKQRFENYEKAYLLLDKYSKQDRYSELEMAGIIQLFETCFELSWKLMKDYIEVEGLRANSPRSSIKTAYQAEIIDDARIWLEILSARNILSHTYDETSARQLINDINSSYLEEFKKLYKRLIEEV